MKLLFSLWVSFVMMFVSFVPGFVPPVSRAENTRTYPYVFVHGLFGWGEDEGINKTLTYWGSTSCRLIDNLKEEGYECYEASVGPVSGNWDRACELYAQLTGTRVDYGAAHSALHDHSRYGRTYDAPMIENWGGKDESGRTNKVNLMVPKLSAAQQNRKIFHRFLKGEKTIGSTLALQSARRITARPALTLRTSCISGICCFR